ncbi:MAG: hypothetical protein LBR26_12400 [Prevotella sp.]|jgi:hypothetical protein|nr:hypothetical protein [Prevotella sp.]
MRRLNNIVACALLLAGVILSGISCRDEVCETVSEPGEKEVVFHLALPADLKAASGSTYMSAAEEKAINEITVLAFVKGTDDAFHYKYRQSGTAVAQTSGETRASFSVKLSYSGSDQRLVILANCNAGIEAAGLSIDEPLSTALPKLIVNETADGGWNNNYLPMAAVTEPISIPIGAWTATIGDQGGLIESPINMIRMLARIDIKLGGAVTNFTLADACLYNRKTKGHVSYNALASEYWDGNAVKKAWVPDNASGTGTGKVYPVTTADEKIEHSIYPFEAAGGGENDKLDVAAIIVGGYYGAGNTTNKTYYRVDIPEYNGTTPLPDTYGDILRNHKYTITINSVFDAGAPDAGTAFNGLVRVEATVEDWNLVDAPVSIDNNQLIISKTRLRYDGGISPDVAKERSVTVTVPAGIKWTAGTNSSWITDVPSTEFTGEQSLNFKVASYYSGPDRIDSIVVTAGNLKKSIKIFQYAGRAIVWTAGPGTAITGGASGTGIRTVEATHKAPWTAAFTTSPTNCLLMTTGATFEWYGVWNTSNTATTDLLIQKTTADTGLPTIRFTSVDGEFGSGTNDWIDLQLSSW